MVGYESLVFRCNENSRGILGRRRSDYRVNTRLFRFDIPRRSVGSPPAVVSLREADVESIVDEIANRGRDCGRRDHMSLVI